MMPIVFAILFILLLLSAAVVFAMKPSQDNLRKKRFKSFEVRAIAHRGLHDEKYDAPENTMAAFRRLLSAAMALNLM